MENNNFVEVKLTIEAEGNYLANQSVMLPKEEAWKLLMHVNRKVNDSLKSMLRPQEYIQEIKMEEPKEINVQIDGKKIAEVLKDSNENSSITKVYSVKEGDSIPKEALEALTYNPPQRSDYSNPFINDEFFTHPKLIAYKCPDCKTITVRRMTLAENNVDNCRCCKNPIEIKQIIRADIQCSSCNDKSYMNLANGLDEINCRVCEAPIDITYYDDNKKAASSNLVR